MSKFLDALRERILLCDGGTGSRVQSMTLDVERDYLGLENCTEVLVKSRPDIVRAIHRSYLEAGSDCVQTNTFGGSPMTLGEFDLEDRGAFEINQRAAELAREAIGEFAGDGRRRFVVGAIGPGTKLPTLGHIAYATRSRPRSSCRPRPDRRRRRRAADRDLPGPAADQGRRQRREDRARRGRKRRHADHRAGDGRDDRHAAGRRRHRRRRRDHRFARRADGLGLNCATGPQEMAEHLRQLSENWPGLISIQPNAGLPELVNGKTHYPLSPDELAKWLERFINDDGINMVGGCCGTGIGHIAALDAMLRRRADNALRPVAKKRSVRDWIPSGRLALLGQVPLRQENAYLSIGERCNANGSKQWQHPAGEARRLGGLRRDGPRAGPRRARTPLDLCTAFVGRDEVRPR
jgi:5-methyltetrahydrofolate--homocysteine methyltransferase